MSWRSLNPNDLLLPAVKLKTLILSHNNLNTLGNLASDELFISASLDTLTLEYCNIISVHGKSPLGGLTAIKTLKLNYNPIRRIQSLISPTLRKLEVSNGQLTYVHHDNFYYLPNLLYLYLNQNSRLTLTTGSTTLLSNSLRYLDLSYCNLMQPSLGGFPNVRKAILNHNMIRTLNSREFLNNSKLEYLDMSYNNIGSVRSDTFHGLNALKYLDLSWNEIANVPEDLLLKMNSLTQINLSRNYISHLGHLRSKSVTIFDLSACEIDSIGKDSLEGLESLIDIDLSRNLLSSLPNSLSSNTLRYLNLNYNRLSSINNSTFYMIPRLTVLTAVGNRFTTIWHTSFFDNNRYLERIDLHDNLWRCDCTDDMYSFFEFLTLEPGKKEEIYNLRCNTPSQVSGMTWFEACYFTWFPGEKENNINSVMWFVLSVIVGLALCFVVVTIIRKAMKRRLRALQAVRERQVEEARDRLRQLRLRAEQEALCNAPDPRDLISPPSYDEALTMPKLSASTHSLCETGSSKTRRKKGRRKTKSSGDLLEETERNGHVPVDEFEMSESTEERNGRRQRRRSRRYGSNEIPELDRSPGARRRHIPDRISDPDDSDGITLEVEADIERPLRSRSRINSDITIHESDL